MVQPAAEIAVGARAAYPHLLLGAEPGRLGLAARLAATCTLTAAITAYYGTPEPALTLYIAFFLVKPDRVTSAIMSVGLTAIITVVIAMVVLIATWVVDAPGWRLFAMSTCSIGLLWLGAASKLKPIAAITALIVVYALALLDRAPGGELATRALLYAWLFVAIPAAVSLLVNLWFAPAPARIAMAALASRLRASAAMLAVSAPSLDAPHTADPRALLNLARTEHWPGPKHLLALEAAAEREATLRLLAQAICEVPGVPRAWHHAAAARLREMADCFARGECPCEVEPVPLHTTQRPGAHGYALLARFNEVLAAFPGAAPAPTLHARAPFLAADAWRNPAYLQYALKTTAAAMACYLLYVMLDWPGIHTCLITCYIVALPTTAETVEKLGLRIAGCVAGAAAGLATLVWVVPSLDSLSALLVTVAVGAFAGGWIAAGSPRVAYAGFQFAFAYFLCVVQGDGPTFDLTIARDRVIGILIGDAAIYLVFAVLWPVRIAPRIDAAFSALCDKLVRLVGLPVAARRRELSEFEARLAAIQSDLALQPFERIGHDDAHWHAVRRRALGAAAKLKPIAFLEQDTVTLHAIADRLRGNAAGSTALTTAAQRRAAALASVLEKARVVSR